MNIPYIRTSLLLACMGFAPLAAAIDCDAVFSNVVGTSGSTLELRDNAALINTGDRVLATGNLQVSGSQDRCDGRPCIESGSGAGTLILPSNSAWLDVSDSSLSLAPGDHYYDNVDFRNSNTLTLTGTGQVRVHVRRDLRIRDNARINVNGDALDLVFLVGDDARIEDDAQVKAVIYAVDRMDVRDDAIVEGALVGDSSQVRGDAAVSYRATAGLEIPSVCTLGGGGVYSGQLNFKIEVGALTVIDTYQKPDFTRVNFTQQFATPPLVFTLPTTDGSNSAAHRIRNVTSDGFDIMTLEPDGEDGPHIAMALNYLAVEEGVHDLPGGRKLIAGKLDTQRVQAYGNAGGGIGWESVSFGGNFSRAPAVLGQIQTMTNEQEARIPSAPSRPWLTTAIDNVTSSGMRLALERSESLTGSVSRDETVGFVAVEPVKRIHFTDSNGTPVEMEVIRTGELLQGWGTCNSNRVYFAQSWAQTPVVLATKNTRDGDAGSGEGDGGWLRRCRSSTSYTDLQVDEVRMNNIGDRNRVHNTPERAGLVMFSGNFVMQARELDHFRLLHDGLGIAGIGETVTIKACKTSDCTQLYTGSVTVTLLPGNGVTSWSGSGVVANQVTFSGGTKVVTLNRTAAGSFNIDLSATPSPKSATRCFVGATETCAITFAATGFSVSLPDQVSGQTAGGTVSLPTCWSDFQSRTVPLTVAAQYLDPAWAGPAVTVNGTVLPTDGSAAAVNLVFDANCSASLGVGYADAGQLGLSVNFVGTGSLSGLTLSGSDSLVFYPAALVASATNGAGNALNASLPGATPVHVATAPFNLSIAAVNAGGAITQAYVPQATDRVIAYAQRTGPTTGFDGIFSVSPSGDVTTQVGPPGGPGDYTVLNIQPGDFSNGLFSNTAAAYTEVGLVTLHLLDTDYMGHAIAATPLPVGRFVPAGLRASGSLTNRVATSGCAGGTFSYMGETLRLSTQLTAVNAAGAVTRNYQGSFAPFSGSGFTRYAGSTGNTVGAVSPGTPLSARLGLSAVGLGVPWSGGVATLDIDLALHPAAAPDGPFDTTAFGLALADGDGVTLGPADTDVDLDGSDEHVSVGAADIRFGRLAVGNAHGSELRELAVPLAMQYFAGAAQGFLVHTADNCTAVATTLLADGDAGDTLTLADTCIVDQLGASGANACAAGTAGTQYRGSALSGAYQVSLKPPGAGRTGAVKVASDAPAWAEFDWAGSGDSDPVGTATFGIYNRDVGVIYQRELR